MIREKVLLQGSFWVIPVSAELCLEFLAEFFDIGFEEIFDERSEAYRRVIILRKKRKYTYLTN